MADSPWLDPTMIPRLRAMWAEGIPLSEIGRRLGISKNAVNAKAHRIDLPTRPSPIVRKPGGKPSPRPRRVTGSTLPPLASLTDA